MGLLFVALAIVGWGVGDFLIQRSARKLGDWEALFFITLFATIFLAPFAVYELYLLSYFDLSSWVQASLSLLQVCSTLRRFGWGRYRL